MAILRTVLSSMWIVAFALELLIWVFTSSQCGMLGVAASVAMMAVSPILYAAEGAELAINALVRKKEGGLSPAASREFRSIEADRSLSFFANRQAFVPICVVILALAPSFVTSLRGIYIPGFGWSDNYLACGLFNLLFPIHITLLLLQIPPKMLALYAPGRFLNQTWWVCAAVRWIGKSEVTAPAKFVTGFLARLLKYPTHHTPTPHTALFYLPMYNPADGWYYIVKEGEHVTTSSDAATRRSSA